MTKEEKREYNKLYLREWRKDPVNREKLKVYRKKWQNDPKNKDKVLAIDRKWKYNNKEKMAIGQKAYYTKHRERLIQVSCKYFKTLKGKMVKQACDNNRRDAEGRFTAEDIKDLYVTQGGRCYYCRVEIEAGYHIDHMLPISRGGTNGPENLALACAPCNLSKHTKTAEEFMTCSV